ncbi:type II secretion system protein N [Halodesulfovibrio sp.]|jgi:type II secretion system protein C|uniref:type II secretion system protein N n=1 Tax=Halodesulfovibrio sp. TaxID=1912772 RepID=UPI0025EB766C|nr:type II secretion system protein N [Halodesulfovibrio sp.]MCT4627385.1 hypothetical protein [Halodesulfovibrio sp.]
MTGILTGKVKIFIELLAITVVSYFLASACYAFFFSEQVVAPKNVMLSANSATTQQKMAFTSFDVIAQRNLLKVKNEAPKPLIALDGSTSTKPNISQRGFSLLGTILGVNPAHSFAIILLNNQQTLYKVGQAVEGWKILTVMRREVLLEQNGVKERLLIDPDVKDAAGAGGVKHVLARSAVKKELGNLAKVARSIQLAPRSVDGTNGLQVRFLRMNSFFYNMGLRKNDLLVEANGKTFASITDATSLLSMLDEKMISLDIIRKGKRQTLTYRLVN